MSHHEATEEYDSRIVANTLLELALDDRRTLTHMEVQKLVYIANGWSLVLRGKRLVEDDPEAWEYGPVYRTLYHEFKRFGSKPIDSFYQELDLNELDYRIPTVDDAEALDLLDEVWAAYSHLSGLQLSSLTHQDGTPWHETIRTKGQNALIDEDLIREHFQELAAKYDIAPSDA